MIDSEEELLMSKERKSAKEIIEVLYSVLEENPLSIGKLTEKSKELGTPIGDLSTERYLKLLMFIQEQVKSGVTISYREEEIAGRTYKSAWLEKT